MPSKRQLVAELITSHAAEVTSCSKAYMDFLVTAARNYKYSFRDQLLIHAQKPNATACAEIGTWNGGAGQQDEFTVQDDTGRDRTVQADSGTITIKCTDQSGVSTSISDWHVSIGSNSSLSYSSHATTGAASIKSSNNDLIISIPVSSGKPSSSEENLIRISFKVKDNVGNTATISDLNAVAFVSKPA